MRSGLVTAGLVGILLLACAGVGLVIGGSGGSAAKGNAGGGGAETTTSQTERGPPKIVVRAFTFSLANSGGNGSGVVSVPTNGSGPGVYQVSIPLPGVQFVLTQQGSSRFFFGQVPFYVVFTNSSGVGQTFVPSGNYTVVAHGTNFNYTTTVSMRYNTVTYLDLKVEPAFFNVTTLEVSNPDMALGIEPAAEVFADVAGAFHFTPDTTYVVVGDYSGTQASPHGLMTLAVDVVGTYPSMGGTWVQLKPTAPYSSVPTSGILLIQYVTNSTVSYSSE